MSDENKFPEARHIDAKPVYRVSIENIELNDSHIFRAVQYVPDHAEGNRGHKDCQAGFITGWSGGGVFVRFRGDTSQRCNAVNLKWGH